MDLRVNKAIHLKRSKCFLYAEVISLFNRRNLRYGRTARVIARAGEASVSGDSLEPLLPIAGFVLEF